MTQAYDGLSLIILAAFAWFCWYITEPRSRK